MTEQEHIQELKNKIKELNLVCKKYAGLLDAAIDDYYIEKQKRLEILSNLKKLLKEK